ncbi:MAG: SMC-Scp complex subunit ScpB [Legionella sp.]|nr:MAG: SMC-Scp complex subunit ScpB [Legionella sp.]PJD99057.1 MAG: SMC-Scp complex subunit ScpB [Legionella sp.]
MDETELKNIVESLLLASQEPLSVDKIIQLFDEWQKPSFEQICGILLSLQKEYEHRSLELIQVASGYRLQTKAQYSSWISKLYKEKPVKYSRALLETLAIIAYKQPVTRADIEDIRGVSVASHIIKTLIEREWIRIAGYKDVPGKPAVYVTTKEFLNYFNLKYLHELPALPEIVNSLNQEGMLPDVECLIHE